MANQPFFGIKNVICFDLKGLEKFLNACKLYVDDSKIILVWGKIMSEPGRVRPKFCHL